MAESYKALRARTNIDRMAQSIKVGSNIGFDSLPAKGYKDGFSGLMRKHNVFPNPEYSFVTCGEDVVLTSQQGEPGCVVSLKLAKKLGNGKFQDLGVRAEYGIAEGSRRFVANRSVHAQHAINGDGGLDLLLRLNN